MSADRLAAAELLRVLRGRDVRITAVGDTLELDAPRGVLTEPLVAQVRARKLEFLQVLGGWHPCVQCGRFAFPSHTVRCYWCRREPTRRGQSTEREAR